MDTGTAAGGTTMIGIPVRCVGCRRRAVARLRMFRNRAPSVHILILDELQ